MFDFAATLKLGGNSRCVIVMTILLLLPLVAKGKREMKREHIQFRCSIYEKKMLKLKARRAGLSLSEYCRGSALGHSIIERLTPEQLKYYSMLVEYKNNFKRISNMFKKRDSRLSKEVEQLANEIRNHLYNFNR